MTGSPSFALLQASGTEARTNSTNPRTNDAATRASLRLAVGQESAPAAIDAEEGVRITRRTARADPGLPGYGADDTCSEERSSRSSFRAMPRPGLSGGIR